MYTAEKSNAHSSLLTHPTVFIDQVFLKEFTKGYVGKFASIVDMKGLGQSQVTVYSAACRRR